ncbi:hypothetical protein ACFQ07_31745 [Actinomadura adrarensis]|uniref:L-tyrosine 3-hydroxylase n=1 Tax=Actinomadura adrarensis TaxID=1819600 RepID=A0ABW3CTF0_9ACTN
MMGPNTAGALVGADPLRDFGDVAYEPEFLLLPHPSEDAAKPADTIFSVEFDGLCRSLRAIAEGDVPQVPPAESPEQLFWFRWITGHQVSFILWHLTGRLLNGLPEPAGLSRMERYTYGYCAMLLYTGSCPRHVYETLIRPSMYLQHPGFSGTWAPDFGPVRSLFRGRHRPGGAGLEAAIELHRTIHDGVAAKLVPDGRSLLQRSLKETTIHRSEIAGVIYDDYFMTRRAAVDIGEVTEQLLRRLRAVALDVVTNGLYPMRDTGAEEIPEELGRAEVGECERNLLDTLLRVGVLAANLLEE